MNKFQEARLVQAIQYARRGWHVLPCGHNKRPTTANGFYDATTDEEQIVRWWEEDPRRLIGIRTGKESGFWAIDVDMKNGKDGIQSLKDFFGNDLTLEDALIQKTATGGFHFCFKYEDHKPVSCAVNCLDGVDVRGGGGFIIAAPSSIRIDGDWEDYEWKPGHLHRELGVAPDWAYQLLEQRSSQSTEVDINAILTTGVSEGVRDDSLFRIARLLEREGVDIDTARTSLALLADCCRPPFDRSTAIQKVDRVYMNYATEQGIKKRLEAIQARKDSAND